jgi:hypothetical protein
MNVNVKHLSLTVAEGLGDAAKNRVIAEKYVLAEDDREMTELVGLLDPACHVTSFAGVVRGPAASIAILENEHETVQVQWETKLLQLTSNTFERRGKAWFVSGRTRRVAQLPVVRECYAWWKQELVSQHIVVGPNQLVSFRSLGLRWQLGVF